VTQRKTKFWSVVAAVTVLAVVAFAVLRPGKSKLEITYREAAATRQDLAVTILATGTVQPQNRVEIKPPIPGRVEEVLAKEGQYVQKGQILAWMSSTERAALLDAARAQGPDELKKWEENYRPTPILAPIPGTVILRNVESGQSFTSTESVFVMSDRLTVKAQVDETDIAQIQLKQSAQIVLDAYPNDKIPGHVDQVAFDAKTVNNVTTYVVDLVPKKTPSFMRSGMTANITFLVSSKRQVVTVPSEAIRVQDGKSSVLLPANSSGAPGEKIVQVGLSDGKQVEILSGLEEGSKILIAEIQTPKTRQEQPKNPFMPGGTRRGTR